MPLAIQVHHAVVMASMSAECLMNYNSTAMSGRAGRNWYVDVRTRLQLIHNLMYHTHTQETAMTISSSWSSNVVEFAGIFENGFLFTPGGQLFTDDDSEWGIWQPLSGIITTGVWNIHLIHFLTFRGSYICTDKHTTLFVAFSVILPCRLRGMEEFFYANTDPSNQ